MKLKIVILSALRSLNRDRNRSFLTMLGIIIGIASVISIVAIGEAYKYKTINDFTNNESGEVMVKVSFMPEGNNYNVYSENYRKIIYNNEQSKALGKLPFVKDVEYNYDSGFFSDYIELDIRGNLVGSTVLKTTGNLNDSNIIGRNLTEKDNLSKRKVIVISDDIIANNVKNVEDLVGAVATIKGISFEIIGVKRTGIDGEDSEQIQIPQETYNKYLDIEKSVQGLKITLDEKADIKESSKEIEDTLNSMKKIPVDGKYIVEDTNGLVELLGGVLVTITTFIALVAGIALLIAGIGLMNMIYTSISERTKEIGIKRALGAKKRDIKREFLVEGIILTMIGGIIGYILGIAIADIISIFFNLTVVPSFFTAMLAIIICVVIGLVSSFIPARKAANCNPVEILR